MTFFTYSTQYLGFFVFFERLLNLRCLG